MKKMIGFFNSMYSDAAAASFLLDFTGRIVWHNNLAEEYAEKIAEFKREIESMRTPSPNWPLPGE